MDGVRTPSMPRTMKKRARSAAIMMRRRLMRSLSAPAVGAAKVAGLDDLEVLVEMANDGEGDGLGLAAGEIEEEMVDGEGVEPVAELADDLGDPEEAVVAVAAKEGEVAGEHGPT